MIALDVAATESKGRGSRKSFRIEDFEDRIRLAESAIYTIASASVFFSACVLYGASGDWSLQEKAKRLSLRGLEPNYNAPKCGTY